MTILLTNRFKIEMKKTAELLRENKLGLLDIWETEVKKEVPASRKANSIALYDHLPNIINDIADIMERHQHIEHIDGDQTFKEIIHNSEQHGRHRSATQLYTADQVVHEYFIFHRTLSDFLIRKDSYNPKIARLLDQIIQTSILKSIASFAQSIQEMQEKLIGTLAHDIRNPLSAAQMALGMMEDEDDDQWKDKLLSASIRSVHKALSLIEGLMDGIAVKAGEGMLMTFEEVDLLTDIKWIVAEAREVYKNEIVFECEEPQILGVFDNVAVRRLLENLIGNAVKYGYPSQPITLNLINKKDELELTVHNHGEPISEQKQESIFNFLAKDSEQTTARKSWGMGLALAQMVVNAHGGKISLESDATKGTTFKIILLKQFGQPGKKRALLQSA